MRRLSGGGAPRLSGLLGSRYKGWKDSRKGSDVEALSARRDKGCHIAGFQNSATRPRNSWRGGTDCFEVKLAETLLARGGNGKIAHPDPP